MLYVFIAVAVAFRLVMLGVSVRNEKALRRGGAVEHGAATTRLLTAAHILFYLGAAAEGIVRRAPFDAVSAAGLLLYVFGAAMLIVVARLLGPLWTVKLMIAPDHALVEHPLFRRVRHPNYYLNILPELAGFALALHAWTTFVVGLSLYAIPLSMRIREEERVMKGRFAGY